MFPRKSQILLPPESIQISAHCPLAALLSPICPAALHGLLSRMLQFVPFSPPPPSLELHLLTDGEIAALNEEYLNCFGPTNILTFPGDRDLPGSLFLSTPCLLRESFLYGQDSRIHMLRLLAHGCAHLAGLEHGSKMARIEEKCFEAARHILESRS